MHARTAAALAAASLLTIAPSLAADGPVCDGTWNTVPSENPKHDYGDYDSLVAVDALSPTDAWAVGITSDFGHPPPGFKTLIEHWDGTRWSRVDCPNSRKTTWDQLADVAVLAPDDAWAVGIENSFPYRDLILHWDGRAWTIQDDGTIAAYLTSVAALSPTDVWVAGSTSYIGKGLLMHWDGVSWTQTLLGAPIVFRDVKALAPDDVWAVGQLSVNYFGDLTVAYHYDGSTWTRTPTPSPLRHHDIDQNWLTSIAAVAPDDIWVTGIARDHDYGIVDMPFFLHWDGTAWSTVDAPDPDGKAADTDLWSSVAFGPNDVWAVGSTGNDPNYSTFTVHWDGVSWTQVPSSRDGRLLGLVSDTEGGLIAVGESTEAATYVGVATLAQQLCR